MFEAIKHNLETISGIEIYPIVSLSIFFAFFMCLGIWVFTYSKEKIDELSRLPLGDDEQ